MLRGTITTLSLIGLLLSVALWGGELLECGGVVHS